MRYRSMARCVAAEVHSIYRNVWNGGPCILERIAADGMASLQRLSHTGDFLRTLSVTVQPQRWHNARRK